MNLNLVQTEIGSLILLRAGIKDSALVLDLLRESASWIKERGLSQWEAFLSEKGPKILERRFSEAEIYLAYLDKKPVATLGLQWQDPFVWDEKGLDQKAGYVHGLAVQRKLAGHHVGKQLMAWVETTVSGHPRPYVRLDCMAENEKLCRYYEKLGFQSVGSKRNETWEVNLLEKRVILEPLRFPKR
ncbi:MAG TPA: GNAT family N-acetyltransferase [bacterium]